MAFKQTPAVLLLHLPPASLAGIDLLSFTTSPRFRGIKNLPHGLHFIFTGINNAFSVRHGLWFLVGGSTQQPHLCITKWQQDAESLIVEQDKAEQLRWRANINEVWREGLTPYRQSTSDTAIETSGDDWTILTSCISPQLLSRITKGDPSHWILTTTSSADRDKDQIPGIKQDDCDPIARDELDFLPIDLKRTWREGATGRERTDGAIDRSWALEHMISAYANTASDVIGELQFCFLMTLTLNNWSCLEQWKRILRLVLTCKSAVHSLSDFYVQFVAAFRQQLLHIKDADGGLIDMADEGGSLLKTLLVRFRRGILEQRSLGGQDVIDELDDLETFLGDEYGWRFGGQYAKSGILELEDGEQIRMDTTEFDEDDETGEYAPQVVELSSAQTSMLYPNEPALLVKLERSAIYDDNNDDDGASSDGTPTPVSDYDASEDGRELIRDVAELDERY